MATRVIDDTKLNDIAVAIQAKDSGGQMTVDEMAGRIEALPTNLISKTITQNGTYAAEDDNADGYSEVTVVVPVPTPVEEKDVNFYDYDGTLLYSYNSAEANNLTSLPELPIKEGINYLNWTKSLETIKSEKCCDIIAHCVSANEYTEMFFRIYSYSPKTITLKLTVTNTVLSIDWGDGTQKDIISSTGNYTHIWNINTYPADIVIKIVKVSGTNWSIGRNYISCVDELNRSLLTEVRIGHSENMNILSQSFEGFSNLKSFIFPQSFSFNNPFNSTSALKVLDLTGINNFSISGMGYANNLITAFLPDTIKTMYKSCFKATSLKSINIPVSLSVIDEAMFSNCMNLRRIFIPSSVTSIQVHAFFYCASLFEIDLSTHDQVPSLQTGNALQLTSNNMIIWVKNQEMLNAFSSATNWSTYADRFQIKEVTP